MKSRLAIMNIFIFLALLVSCKAPSARAVNRAPVGGGSTKAGFQSEYFANTQFQGEPAFIRRDVRIMHHWKEGPAGGGFPVGGATTPGMADFPVDDFSIRWTGQLVPQFNEIYTFYITGKDGVRVRMRPEGGEWTSLVESLDKAAEVQKETPVLQSGRKYDIVFEYVDRAGTNASVEHLEWSSRSTPRKVIEPLSRAQIDTHQAAPQT